MQLAVADDGSLLREMYGPVLQRMGAGEQATLLDAAAEVEAEEVEEDYDLLDDLDEQSGHGCEPETGQELPFGVLSDRALQCCWTELRGRGKGQSRICCSVARLLQHLAYDAYQSLNMLLLPRPG
jgi:hypothetical protein